MVFGEQPASAGKPSRVATGGVRGIEDGAEKRNFTVFRILRRYCYERP